MVQSARRMILPHFPVKNLLSDEQWCASSLDCIAVINVYFLKFGDGMSSTGQNI